MLVEYILELCRRFKLLENEGSTFFSYQDHLLALELCISRLEQDKDGILPKVKREEVMNCHTAYVQQCTSVQKDYAEKQQHEHAVLSYKKFLKHSNCIDIWSMLSLILSDAENGKWQKLREQNSFLILGSVEAEITKHILRVLSGNEVFLLSMESPLNSSLENSPSSKEHISVNFEKQLTKLDDISISARETSRHISATEEYAEEIILALLSLLVNCRNELALSKAIISPLIDLGHQAFTDIKHVSLQKEMPMCQTVISYVTRMRLGGKGYAPAADCPLKQHLKGLEQFVDLLNKLHSVIEEDASTESAVKRAINILKNKLIRCSGDKLRRSSIEDVAQRLTKDVSHIIQMNCKVSTDEKSSQIGHKAFMALEHLVNHRNLTNYYSSFDGDEIPKQEDKNKTPINLPPLLGYFRSPEEPEEDSTINEDSQMSSTSLNVVHTNDSSSVTSYFHSNDSCSTQKSCIDAKLPTRLTFKGIFEDKVQNTSVSNSQSGKIITEKHVPSKPGAKRSILGDISNEKVAKRANTKSTKSKKSAPKPTKQKSQIKGQGQITKFFVRA